MLRTYIRRVHFLNADPPSKAMATGLKVDIQWSSCSPDKFITFGSTEMSLYRVETIKDKDKDKDIDKDKEGDIKVEDIDSIKKIRFSETQYAELVVKNSAPQYLKSLAWCPVQQYETLLALGLANGKIILSSFGSNPETSNLVGRDFVPRHLRQCNCLAFNPADANLLASGFERVKGDNSILIWDALRSDKNGSNASDISNPLPAKPVYEMGNSEAVYSFQWFKQQPQTFVCGLSNRYLRVYDYRDSNTNKSHLQTQTRAVHGVTVDKLSEYRLASFSEAQIIIWDTRNFEKPHLTTIPETKYTTKIMWCPTRSNLLAAVSRENYYGIKLYDIQQTTSSDDVELTSFERHLLPTGPQYLSSFTWHPTDKKRLILVNHIGTIKDSTIFERMSVAWSGSALHWTDKSKHVRNVTSPSYFEALNDVSVKIKLRAQRSYAIESCEPEKVITDDTRINTLWSWMNMVKTMQESGSFSQWDRPFKFEGIKDLICSENGGTNAKSDIVEQEWPSDSAQSTITTTIYRSKDRDHALQLCGWGFDRTGAQLSTFLDNLEKENQFERAAAIAIFNLQIHKAIELLSRGAEHEANTATSTAPGPKLSVVAMALSGFTPDKNALWRRMCSSTRRELENSYLIAIFAFLTCEEDGFDDILVDDKIALSDRVAFASLFLSDEKLSSYINKLTRKLITRGNVEGILLTGLIGDGVELLQRYIDNTGDVQTSCLIIMHSNPPKEITDDLRIWHWIDSYRLLLDKLELYEERCEFDVKWNQISKSQLRQISHIYVSCNYCGKSIASSMDTQAALAVAKSHHPSMVANRRKVSTCPGCRKPLTRCAVCRLNMGTASGTGVVKNPEVKTDVKVTKFSTWMVWCQTCRHGGHVGHIQEWFTTNNECPVTGCKCNCSSLD